MPNVAILLDAFLFNNHYHFAADFVVITNTILLNPITRPVDCFVIQVIDDQFVEGAEVINVTISLSSDISPDPATQLQFPNPFTTITIVDDDCMFNGFCS